MRTLLTGATLIDGSTGDAQKNAAILIDGQKIAGVGRAEALPADWAADQVLDLKDRFVIPGLFNLHDHIYRKNIRTIRTGWTYDQHSRDIERENDNYLVLSAAHHALDSLRSGVTTIRNVGSRSNLVVSLKRAINQGLVTGPRLKVAVRPIVMTGGHGYYIGRQADGPDEVRKATREQLRDGADFIKLIVTGGILGMPKEHPGNAQFTVDEIRAAVDVAHDAGKRTTAHADANAGIRNAIEAGIDCIEHGTFLTDETIELMLKHDIPLVPTLSGKRGYAEYHLPGNREFYEFVYREGIAPQMVSVRKAYEAGVKIGVGTDTATLVADELEDLCKTGLSPRECIAAATSVSAEIVGMEREVGTIEPGKLADLVVLKNDPWKDISAVRQVDFVMKGGEMIRADDPIL
jgi:imidazolonepropionase-like amidohydrolase